jgi:hypothetical protein
MEDFNSKYTGQQVEDLLDQVASGNTGGGGIEAETDPIFLESPAATITNEQISAWNNKVDKETGKGLSTEDFTTALKTKLEGLSNYDDTEIENALSSLQTQINTLVSGNASDAINSFNEIIAFLDGVKDTEDLEGIIASIEQQIAGKQDAISDLETIRDGASKGATSVQPNDISEFITVDDVAKVATSGSYNDLVDKPTIPSAINIAGTNYTPSDTGIIDLNPASLYRKPSGGIPKTDLSSEVQTALTNADTYKGTVTGVKINGTTKSPSNGIVDLGNIPASIPTEVYVADFTMESLREGMYNGTQVNCDMQGLITAMEANKVILVRESEDSAYRGVSVLNVFLEDLLYFSIVDTHGNILWSEGTPYGAEVSYINGASLHLRSWDEKQDVLVSGNNIKTINGESIVGSGNITISGGSGTITEIKANGTSIAKSGVANIPAATTSAYGVTKLTNSTSSTSTTLAATASAVKSAYDLANSYKGTVTGVKVNGSTKSPTSGTVDIGNVVTSVKVNGSTYSPSSGVVDLGTISSGGSSGGGESYAGNYPIMKYYASPYGSSTLFANTYVIIENAISSQVYFSLEYIVGESVHEYVVAFYVASNSTSIIFEDDVYWINDDVPIIEEGYTYIISVVDKIAIYCKVTGNVYNAYIEEDNGGDSPFD